MQCNESISMLHNQIQSQSNATYAKKVVSQSQQGPKRQNEGKGYINKKKPPHGGMLLEMSQGIIQDLAKKKKKEDMDQTSYSMLSTNAFNLELSLVAIKYVPPTSVQLTLLDQ